MSDPSRIIPIFLAVLSVVICAKSQVPDSETFTFVNAGEFGDYITEYDASYRLIRGVDGVAIGTFPFQLCFYNTTPGAHVFAIRAGVPRDEDLMRWVWDANRHNPVGENATFSLRRDGNLVLADADKRVAWQTNTANKGVVKLELLPNGNLVLLDSRGRFVWQSFEHPVDTLLVGMSLKLDGINKLVSRVSATDGSDGPYSFVLNSHGLILYYNISGKAVRYGGWEIQGNNATFLVEPENENATAYELVIRLASNQLPSRRRLLQSRPIGNAGVRILWKLNYNATYSFLRIESDGNLKTYTYYNEVSYLKWEESFAYFSNKYVTECLLPAKCGKYGLCQRGMCVACPSPRGLLGWSDDCSPPSIGQCSAGSSADYYRIAAAEHFTSRFEEGEGPLKLEQCRAKCSRDCKCRGFVYKADTSKCLLTPLLATLRSSANTSSVYVKYSNK